jgi:P4 family phage/plasmid primase-like protien
MNFALSINKNIKDKGDPRLGGWENALFNVDDLIEHISNGFAYSAGVLKASFLDKKKIRDSKPSRDDVEFAELLSVDIDNTMFVFDELIKQSRPIKKDLEHGYFSFTNAMEDDFVQNNALLIYTTPSHTEEHHRFRIVFKLPKKISDPVEYAKISEAFITKFNGDKACKNIDRLFYGNQNTNCLELGNVLTEKVIESLLNASTNEAKAYKEYDNSNQGGITSTMAAEMLSHIPKQMAYDEWGKIVSGIGNYFDEATAIKLIDEWSPDTERGTEYRIKHRSKKPTIASVIYYACLHGYDKNKLYDNSGPRQYQYNNHPYGGHSQPVPFQFYAGNNQMGSKKYDLTEVGNAHRFVDKHHNLLRFDHRAGAWYIWDGKRFQIDNDGLVYEMAQIVVKDIAKDVAFVDANTKEGDSIRDAITKWSKKSQTRAALSNLIFLAAQGTVLATTIEKFDADPYSINTKSATLNIRDWTGSDHLPEAMHSKLIDIDYDDDATCPRWEAFLDEIFLGDKELIEFIQRAVGYSLTGLTSEQCLFFAYGTGKNGKSIFFNVMEMLFGDYYQKAPAEMLMIRRNEGIPNDIARLRGARFVVASELAENGRFNEAKIKDLTGGDIISARFLHGEFFEFRPVHKLWIYGNHKPIISGTDKGIWRRLKLIPFEYTVPDDKVVPQEQLLDSFRQELPGILAWAVDGCIKWKESGLNKPKRITDATEEYKEDMDILGNFLAANVADKQGAQLTNKELYAKYKEWTTENGDYPISGKKMAKILKERGWEFVVYRERALIWLNHELISTETPTIGF